MGKLESKKSQEPTVATSLEETHANLLGCELEYRNEHPLAWWLALVGPALITIVLLGIVYLTNGHEVVFSYLAAAATAFVFLGRFIILVGANDPDPEQGLLFLKYLDARNLFMMLTYLDVMVAIFVAFHMGIIFRIPIVGAKIAGMMTDGQFILRQQPWIRRAAFVGLVCFVIFPTSTTGSIGGSIFGRLLGMKRWRVVGAILVGSVLGNGLMLLFSEQLSKLKITDNWTLRIGGVLAMMFALFLFERKFRSLKEHYVAQEKLRQSEAELKSPKVQPPTETTIKNESTKVSSFNAIAESRSSGQTK